MLKIHQILSVNVQGCASLLISTLSREGYQPIRKPPFMEDQFISLSLASLSLSLSLSLQYKT